MVIHNVEVGEKIICNINSRIWLSVGEVFTVKRIIQSQLTGEYGVVFLDRFNGERIFWDTSEYKLARLICEEEGHDWDTYTVSTGYWSNDIEQAGYCMRCGFDTHGEYGGLE